MDNHTTYMGKDCCPTCFYKVDAASPLEGEHIPMPGDLSICLSCGEYLYFEDDMRLGVFPQVLFEDLPAPTKGQLQDMRYAIRKMGFGVKWDKRVNDQNTQALE